MVSNIVIIIHLVINIHCTKEKNQQKGQVQRSRGGFYNE